MAGYQNKWAFVQHVGKGGHPDKMIPSPCSLVKKDGPKTFYKGLALWENDVEPISPLPTPLPLLHFLHCDQHQRSVRWIPGVPINSEH